MIFHNLLSIDDTSTSVSMPIMWAGIHNAKRHAQGYIEDKNPPRSLRWLKFAAQGSMHCMLIFHVEYSMTHI